jgi:hypothetical protein
MISMADTMPELVLVAETDPAAARPPRSWPTEPQTTPGIFIEMTTTKIFISYSYDSEEHKAWVIGLSQTLEL